MPWTGCLYLTFARTRCAPFRGDAGWIRLMPGGRPRKPLDLHRVLNTVNVTRHRERLAVAAGVALAQEAPPMQASSRATTAKTTTLLYERDRKFGEVNDLRCNRPRDQIADRTHAACSHHNPIAAQSLGA